MWRCCRTWKDDRDTRQAWQEKTAQPCLRNSHASFPAINYRVPLCSQRNSNPSRKHQPSQDSSQESRVGLSSWLHQNEKKKTRTTNPKLKLAACPSHVCTFLAKLAHLSIERWLMVVPSGKMSSRSGNPSPVNTPSCFSRLALPHRSTTHRSQVKKEQSTKQQSPNGQR